MTTTDQFNSKKDFYSSVEDCENSKFSNIQTNPRYKLFTPQFTAGDIEQFEEYRFPRNNQFSIPNIPLDNNIFKNNDIPPFWNKYRELKTNDISNTFNYIFYKFKKGIFIKIFEGKLKVFLPFTNVNYINDWSSHIKIDPKFKDLNSFIHHINKLEDRSSTNPNNINQNINTWHGNNCLIRYEYPIQESGTNNSIFKNMLEELCANRSIPDIELFINRRDFPILKSNLTEPYNHLFDSDNQPLLSHKYDRYCPILSMSKTNDYSDILMPLHEDWARIQSKNNIYFPKAIKDFQDDIFGTIPWDSKKPIAIFRGSSTGCGTTVHNNIRLKLCQLSYDLSTRLKKESKNIESKILDAGITKWNIRPRKYQGEPYLQTIDKKALSHLSAPFLKPIEQAGFKYIINVDGHVTAFRLSLELSMGSVILMVKSDWKIWYSHLLKKDVHYLEIKEDLSDLIDTIKWCRNNDDKCKQIADNAKQFYNTYLQKDGILDYLQLLFIRLKQHTGIYLYNVISPLDLSINKEYSSLYKKNNDTTTHPENKSNNLFINIYPDTTKTIKDINKFPNYYRSFDYLQGINWIINMIFSKSKITDFITYNSDIFKSINSIVRLYSLKNYNLVVKSTNNQQKMKEHIHESFIGIKEINKLLESIPNFVYTFGIFKNYDIHDTTINIINEYVKGQTLQRYINSSSFNLNEFLFILIQICLALEVAQRECMFVHYDLKPWNIMLQKVPYVVSIDYKINVDKIIRINTNLIPIIIDYGKSYVIHDNRHHGFVMKYKFSTIQDVLCILLSSINDILKSQKLSTSDMKVIFLLTEFFTGSSYKPDKFKSIHELKAFLKTSIKYQEIISSNKYELEIKTPMDLIDFIYSKIGINKVKTKEENKYNFDYKILGKDDVYTRMMNRYNAKQVFDYTLCNTQEEYLDTYLNIFKTFVNSELNIPNNKFIFYYLVQELYNNIIVIKKSLDKFIIDNKITELTNIKLIVKQALDKIDKIYVENKDKVINKNLSCNIFNINVDSISEEIFSDPEEVCNLLDKIKDINLSKYNLDIVECKEMIENVFLFRGKYQLEKDREIYREWFRELLMSVDIKKVKVNIANLVTLRNVSSELYKLNLNVIEKREDNSKDEIEKYVQWYKKCLKV